MENVIIKNKQLYKVVMGCFSNTKTQNSGVVPQQAFYGNAIIMSLSKSWLQFDF